MFDFTSFNQKNIAIVALKCLSILKQIQHALQCCNITKESQMCIVNVKRKVSQQQISHFCRIIVIVSISTMHNVHCTYMFLAFSPLACKTHIFLSRLSYPPSVCYTLLPGVLVACPQHLLSDWSSRQLQWSVFSLCKHSRLQWTRKSFVKRSGRTFVIGKMPRKGKWTIKVSVKHLPAICTSSLLPPTDRPVLFLRDSSGRETPSCLGICTFKLLSFDSQKVEFVVYISISRKLLL